MTARNKKNTFLLYSYILISVVIPVIVTTIAGVNVMSGVMEKYSDSVATMTVFGIFSGGLLVTFVAHLFPQDNKKAHVIILTYVANFAIVFFIQSSAVLDALVQYGLMSMMSIFVVILLFLILPVSKHMLYKNSKRSEDPSRDYLGPILLVVLFLFPIFFLSYLAISIFWQETILSTVSFFAYSTVMIFFSSFVMYKESEVIQRKRIYTSTRRRGPHRIHTK